MEIFIEKENKKLEKRYNGSVQSLLTMLNINPETVIVVKGDELVTEDDEVKDSDSIRILSVVSGG